MRPIRNLGIVLVVVLTSSACGSQATTPRDYSLGVLPGTNLELGWWATVTKTEDPPPSPGGAQIVEVNVPSDVLFAEGESDLTPEADVALAEIAQDINARAGRNVLVVGHTDHFGDTAFNQQLGQLRADAVASALHVHEVPEETINPPQSAGESSPLCPETRANGADDSDCRARNRRVLITYTYTVPEPEGR
jgi:OOP family OmpA-OmpF porin